MDGNIPSSLNSSAVPTPLSSRPPSRRTSVTSPATSMSDLTQYLNRSTLTCRRTSLETRLRPSVSMSCPCTHRTRRHHRPRRPSSSSSSSSSRSNPQLSRIDSLVTTLIDSDSETYQPSSSLSSNGSAATSPSPSLSPIDLVDPAASYFTLRHHVPQAMAPVCSFSPALSK